MVSTKGRVFYGGWAFAGADGDGYFLLIKSGADPEDRETFGQTVDIDRGEIGSPKMFQGLLKFGEWVEHDLTETEANKIEEILKRTKVKP